MKTKPLSWETTALRDTRKCHQQLPRNSETGNSSLETGKGRRWKLQPWDGMVFRINSNFFACVFTCERCFHCPMLTNIVISFCIFYFAFFSFLHFVSLSIWPFSFFLFSNGSFALSYVEKCGQSVKVVHAKEGGRVQYQQQQVFFLLFRI